MRLIDADALKERLIANIGLTNCIDTSFKEVPTIDAVEVVHGEWTTKRTWEHDGETYCSICGHDGTVVWNYCPHCGAKMGGKEQNDG